jgi:hypothetical protein
MVMDNLSKGPWNSAGVVKTGAGKLTNALLFTDSSVSKYQRHDPEKKSKNSLSYPSMSAAESFDCFKRV